MPNTAHSIQLFGTIPAMTVLSCVEPNKKNDSNHTNYQQRQYLFGKAP